MPMAIHAARLMTIRNPKGFSAKGTGTFMPHKPLMSVGIAKIMVTDAKNFMTRFRLLLMMLAKTSIMLLRMWLFYSLLIFDDNIVQQILIFFVYLYKMLGLCRIAQTQQSFQYNGITAQRCGKVG